ncbi:GNAT family N-acetyltransferase [Silvanigrella aquatica]|uniref:N-acetyltransferase domain-containing protein n=1 Tax=Silvanigrella aquatica TaxID=1915309 RepID=A0A1L4D1N4_9BACT|nr:GNAT family N-acetyltransferase [Silvanigrella aquatica]APJ04100.1 hypothetical protein AXG55_09345 [Silvanigrella aquatica]
MKPLSQICEELMVNKFFYIPKVFDKCNFLETDEMILAKSPYHSSLFNICWIKKINPIYFENSLRHIIEFFYPKPFALWFGMNLSTQDIEFTLNSLGFIKKNSRFNMVSDLKSITYFDKYIENIKISKITCDLELDIFLDVIEDFEPCARGYFKKVFRELGYSNLQPYHFFYLNVANEPVCIGSIYFQNNICGICEIFTHPNFRKKGYARKILNFIMNYSKENNINYLSLVASVKFDLDLKSIAMKYKNLGFMEQGEYSCYEYEGSGFQ